jgi:hypothetical protein
MPDRCHRHSRAVLNVSHIDGDVFGVLPWLAGLIGKLARTVFWAAAGEAVTS